MIFRCPLKSEQRCLAFIFLKYSPLSKLKMTKVRVQSSTPEFFFLKRPLGQCVVLRGPYRFSAVPQYLPPCPRAHNPKLSGAVAQAAPQRGRSLFAWQERIRLQSSLIAVPCSVARGSAASDFENKLHEVVFKMSCGAFGRNLLMMDLYMVTGSQTW